MQKIRTFLWFNDNLEEAMKFYVSVFKNSKMGDLMRGPDGKVMGGTFQLEGQEFYALNGGPHYKFTPAISFFIHCETQSEIDDFWEKLSAGGTQERCGWLKDKFGVSWQVVPSILGKLLQNPDPEKSKRVMAAMLQMKKLDIKGLQQAAEGA